MKEIMSYPVIVGKIDESIFEIANKMKQYQIGFLPIAKDNKIIGVITDRDLVVGPLSNHDIEASLENYITHRVISIAHNKDVDTVLEYMAKYQIKRVLVTENQKVIGVISLSDLLQLDAKKIVSTLQTIDQNANHQTQENLEIDSFYL